MKRTILPLLFFFSLFVKGDEERLATLIQALDDKDDQVVAQAIDELGKMGAEAIPAMEPLRILMCRTAQLSYEEQQKLRNNDLSFAVVYPGRAEICRLAATALGKIGNHHLPLLEEQMWELCLKKGYFGTNYSYQCLPLVLAEVESKERIAFLIKRLSDSEWRVYVLEVLEDLGEKAEPAVPYLIGMLGDEDPYIRASAAKTLGEIGPKATPAIPHLIKALFDETYRPAWIRQMETKPQFPISIFQGYEYNTYHEYPDNYYYVRHSAAVALTQIGEPAVPAVIEVYSRCEKDLKITLMVTLGKIGEKAASTQPHLERVLSDPDPEIRRRAVWALGCLHSLTAFPVFAGLLTDADDVVRANAVTALGYYGEQSYDLIVRALSDRSGRVRAAAVDALAQYGERVFPLLLLALDDFGKNGGEGSVASHAHDALVGYGSKTSALCKALTDERLAQYHPQLRKILTSVAAIQIDRLLKEPYWERQWPLLKQLREIGAPALPQLERALEDKKYSELHLQIRKVIEDIRKEE